MKAYKKANKGTSLKAVPKENKGLSKLPTSVRNKMGYAEKGSSVNPPRRFTKAGVTYVYDEESGNYYGDLAGNVPKGGMSSDFGTAFKAAKRYGKETFTWQGKKYNTKTKEEMKSVKKMKNGGKVGDPPKKKPKMSYNKTVKDLPKMSYKKTVKDLPKKKSPVKPPVKSNDISDVDRFTSGPQLIKYYMSQGMSREQAVAKMVKAKTGKSFKHGGKVKAVKKKK
jgi:hypothetical protein